MFWKGLKKNPGPVLKLEGESRALSKSRPKVILERTGVG